MPAVAAAAALRTEGSVASSNNSLREQQQLHEDAQINGDELDTDADAAMVATVDLAATVSDL